MDTTSLAARVDRLERQNRMLKRAGALGALFVAALLLSGQGGSGVAGVQKASGFQLVDDKGVTRGMWGFAGDGSPTMQLFDAKGRPRIGMSLLADKVPSLAFTDKEGKLRAVIKVLEEFGTPTFQMFDPLGVPRTGLSVLSAADGKAEPTLVLLDEKARMRTLIKVLRDGSPVVTLNDERAKPRAGMRLDEKTSAPSLIFNHEDDRAHLQMRLAADGSPRLIMNDQHGSVLFKAP